MRCEVAVIAAVLAAAPTQFGPQDFVATLNPGKSDRQLTRISYTSPDSVVDPDLVAVEPAMTDIAALRDPEGPPAAPPDAPIEAVCDMLAAAAQTYGIPTGFFARLIWQESKFQQRIVSHAGAQGVAQFMPAVAAQRGLHNPFDPMTALPHSARFLREHVNYFGNLGLAAAAYNGGARRVTDWLARRGSLPEETRNYVKIITGHAPETWTQKSEIDLPVNLPQRAPCEGVADLSRGAEPAKVEIQLEAPVARIIEDARIAAAKAAEAARARLAAKKSKREKLLAKGKGGKSKTLKLAGAGRVAAKADPISAKRAAKIADRAPTDKGGKAGKRVKVADTTGARR